MNYKRLFYGRWIQPSFDVAISDYSSLQLELFQLCDFLDVRVMLRSPAEPLFRGRVVVQSVVVLDSGKTNSEDSPLMKHKAFKPSVLLRNLSARAFSAGYNGNIRE